MHNVKQITDSAYLLTMLTDQLAEEQGYLELSESVISAEERAESELKIVRLTNIIQELKAKRPEDGHCSLSPEIIEKFTCWDPSPTIESLTFLLNEFFSKSYLEGNYNKEFVGEMVFQVTRVIDFLSKVKISNTQLPPAP